MKRQLILVLCRLSGILYRRHERVHPSKLTERPNGTPWYQAAMMCQRLVGRLR